MQSAVSQQVVEFGTGKSCFKGKRHSAAGDLDVPKSGRKNCVPTCLLLSIVLRRPQGGRQRRHAKNIAEKAVRLRR